MTVKCLSYGSTLDNLYIVRDTDENSTVLCYVYSPYGNKVRKILQEHSGILPGIYYVPGLAIRKVKDYRRVDQLKGIEIMKVNRNHV